MRSVVALVFTYSLNGLLADPDTDFWKFVFESLDEHGGPDQDQDTMDLLNGASAHLMGRVAYEGLAKAMSTNTEHCSTTCRRPTASSSSPARPMRRVSSSCTTSGIVD